MDSQNPPLSYVASASHDPHVSQSLPPEVIACLKNARFLHLATCESDVPHVSLMNYTYLPSTPYRSSPTIIMTTNPASKKTENLLSNPRVSLLVHDWVSHRPPTQGVPTGRSASPNAGRTQSSLAAMLINMNTSALSRISTTIDGTAQILETGSEEEQWCKEMHLQNNTFEQDPNSSPTFFGTSPGQQGDAAGDGGRGCFIEGEAVRVVVVTITEGRISDWKGAVRDWAIGPRSGDGLENGM